MKPVPDLHQPIPMGTYVTVPEGYTDEPGKALGKIVGVHYYIESNDFWDTIQLFSYIVLLNVEHTWYNEKIHAVLVPGTELVQENPNLQ